MRFTWIQVAGFIVASAAIFALALARGEMMTREQQASRERIPLELFEASQPQLPAVEMMTTQAEATFIHEVPAYPYAIGGREISAGSARDLFGSPMRLKTFTTQRMPDEVIRFYERTFALKSYNTYPVYANAPTKHSGATVEEAISGLGAIDMSRRMQYIVSAARSLGANHTRVSVAWIDGTKSLRPNAELVPLEIESEPVLVTGDGKQTEMAVYMVSGSPSQVYSKFDRQLGASGWARDVAPTETAQKRMDSVHRSYVKGGRHFVLTARPKGDRTMLICQITPRSS